MSNLFVLLGFTMYFISIKHTIKIKTQYEVVNKVTDDWLMFGTMLTISHVLEVYLGSKKIKLFNKDWIITTLFILIGFTAYRIGTSFVDPTNINPTIRPAFQDLVQFGTMLTVSRILEQGSIIDQTWLTQTLFVLFGFAMYHIFTKKLVHTQ